MCSYYRYGVMCLFSICIISGLILVCRRVLLYYNKPRIGVLIIFYNIYYYLRTPWSYNRIQTIYEEGQIISSFVMMNCIQYTRIMETLKYSYTDISYYYIGIVYFKETCVNPTDPKKNVLTHTIHKGKRKKRLSSYI